MATSEDVSHFVGVTATIGTGVAPLREHRAYLDGLDTGFGPDEFLRDMAGYVGLAAGFHRWADRAVRLEQSRARLLERGPALIVPGHGEPFTPA